MNTAHYLTISELGCLRNVDSKSLRYYERIGALIPAYVDPHTQYRYYTIEQLVDLDTILLCLQMGIPLKDASKYRDEDGTLSVKKLFEDGKVIVENKIKNYKRTLERLQYSLDCIDANDTYKGKDDQYIRYISQRYIIKTPLEDPKDFLSFTQQSVALFTRAKDYGLDSGYAFPIGILIERTAQQATAVNMFLEVLNPPTDHEDICILEAREYQCYQLSQPALFQSYATYESILAEHKDAQSIIITNIALDRYRHDIFPIEVQL